MLMVPCPRPRLAGAAGRSGGLRSCTVLVLLLAVGTEAQNRLRFRAKDLQSVRVARKTGRRKLLGVGDACVPAAVDPCSPLPYGNKVCICESRRLSADDSFVNSTSRDVNSTADGRRLFGAPAAQTCTCQAAPSPLPLPPNPPNPPPLPPSPLPPAAPPPPACPWATCAVEHFDLTAIHPDLKSFLGGFGSDSHAYFVPSPYSGSGAGGGRAVRVSFADFSASGPASGQNAAAPSTPSARPARTSRGCG